MTERLLNTMHGDGSDGGRWCCVCESVSLFRKCVVKAVGQLNCCGERFGLGGWRCAVG